MKNFTPHLAGFHYFLGQHYTKLQIFKNATPLSQERFNCDTVWKAGIHLSQIVGTFCDNP